MEQPTYGGGLFDAFLVKFNLSGTLQWCTYYGGSDNDHGFSCASDKMGYVYLSGRTYSSNNIATPLSFIDSYQGNGDAFLAKFLASPPLTAPTEITATPNPICAGQTVTLEVADALSDNTNGDWYWYEGSCGNGTPVGIGSSITVNPLAQTNYYVREEGPCGISDCGEITITINQQHPWPYHPYGDYREYGTSISSDNDGNIYATGHFNSNITFANYTFTSGSYGTKNSYIVKFDECGDVLWARQLYSAYEVVINKITVDGNADFIVSGHFDGFVNFGNGHLGTNPGIFVAKYHWNSGTSTYDCQWLYTNANATGDGFDLVTDANNDVYIAGTIVPATNDVFVAKLASANGNVLWSNTENSGGQDYGYGITYCPSCSAGGRILITGRKEWSIFISIYDEGYGTLGNSATYITQGAGNSIVSYFDGTDNYAYIAGYTKDIATGYKEILLIKVKVSQLNNLNPYLNGGSFSQLGDIATDMEIDPDGNLFITGQFSSNSLTFIPGPSNQIFKTGNSDNFVVKYSTSEDKFKWARNSGLINDINEQSFAVHVKDNNFGYITGTFMNDALFGSVLLSATSSEDVFIARIQDFTTYGEFRNLNQEQTNTMPAEPINIYPNPTSDKLFIDFSYGEKNLTIIKMYNMMGLQVNKTIVVYLEKDKVAIDVSKFLSGLYILKIETNQKVYNYKIIKE